ncbi:MAG: YkvA family protein [Chloroflexi bacterium]|nr:YkvA family protein [Chloroflexota bacterium]MDA1145248.1 YkvA family protein [Chloroflexota bacterium]
MFANWQARVRALRRETYVLYLAARDPRTPWYARVIAFATVAYALSPLDLIPDVIPVIGYLDDLLIVPAGLLLARRLIPPEVLEAHRDAVASSVGTGISRLGLAIVVVTWLLTAALTGALILRLR